ncbi:MAG: hypothetical protein DRP63_02625 [Planctomycetota bacterium]|nr:MAG: hypothetical protein DRP63_02625 [Planctomycetota bacterium]
MARIFISHSSKDKEFATRLAQDLKEMGHQPWLDEWEIKVGECIVTKIEEGVSVSDYMVIVLTQDSISSGWVEKEWKSAYWREIERKKVVVLPALLSQCEIPPLLRTKRYADFTKGYAVGFAHLVQAIMPPSLETAKTQLMGQHHAEEKISDLLAKIQGKKTPLAQCIAEALPIARQYNDKELECFCRNELAGWDVQEIESGHEINYRLIEVFCSFVKINPQYVGWGGRASNIFSYMEEHPQEFFLRKMLVTEPISKLEQKREPSCAPEKAFMCWTQPITDFIPDSSSSEARIFCYARADAYERVVEAIRVELTKRLLNLLPGISNSKE